MNPYRIDGPAVISFSGGRTSAYMLRKILDAHGGTLPDDVVVTFANTGKEREETLVFVRECGERWGVPIVWLEYIVTGEPESPRDLASAESFRVVSFETASRNGEPFEAAIRLRGYLPGAGLRYCTELLKLRTQARHALSLGWSEWTRIVGLRADEWHRVVKARDRGHQHGETECPLATARVTEADVLAFWDAQPFDLGLKNYEGNCDVCFLKSLPKRVQLARDNPEQFDWWIEQELWAQNAGATSSRFAPNEPSYSAIRAFAHNQIRLPIVADNKDSLPCACTD